MFELRASFPAKDGWQKVANHCAVASARSPLSSGMDDDGRGNVTYWLYWEVELWDDVQWMRQRLQRIPGVYIAIQEYTTMQVDDDLLPPP